MVPSYAVRAKTENGADGKSGAAAAGERGLAKAEEGTKQRFCGGHLRWEGKQQPPVISTGIPATSDRIIFLRLQQLSAPRRSRRPWAAHPIVEPARSRGGPKGRRSLNRCASNWSKCCPAGWHGKRRRRVARTRPRWRAHRAPRCSLARACPRLFPRCPHGCPNRLWVRRAGHSRSQFSSPPEFSPGRRAGLGARRA